MTLHLHHPPDELEPAPGAARMAELCGLMIEALLTEPSPRMRAVLCCAAMSTIGDAVRDSLGSWGETVQ
jgi:hypothetical protein